MRVLLTNDDGIASEGIQTLARRLSADHEVWIVAPDTEKSGSSHCMTLRDSIRLRKAGERSFSCRGTPVDCVLVAFLGIIPGGVDMVISGINHGPNLGTDILYSGTAGAARQGVLLGIPSVALSLCSYSAPFDFTSAADFAARNIETFANHWTDDFFLNINFPNKGCAKALPVITFPSRRIYRDELSTFNAPNGDVYCFIGGGLPDSHLEEGSDSQVVSSGGISISPIHAHPRNWSDVEERYRGVRFR